jgi:cell division protein FtsB
LREQEKSNLEARNAELEYRIKHSNDPDTIQKIAREKLGLVKPGEIIFYRTNG